MTDNKLYLVKWIDSRGVSTSWTEFEELEQRNTCVVESVGWLIEHGDWVTVIPHRGDNPKQGCGEMTIPRICIKTITRLEEWSYESKVPSDV